MLRKPSTKHPLRWCLTVALGLTLASITSIKAYAAYPYIETWSEMYAGNWTASTDLSVVADRIVHTGRTTSSIGISDPLPQESDSTSWFRNDTPTHIDCASQTETVYTSTWHSVDVGVYHYEQQSTGEIDCGSANS
jgi:hypothetical protein